jgi:hypothetical protein
MVSSGFKVLHAACVRQKRHRREDDVACDDSEMLPAAERLRSAPSPGGRVPSPSTPSGRRHSPGRWGRDPDHLHAQSVVYAPIEPRSRRGRPPAASSTAKITHHVFSRAVSALGGCVIIEATLCARSWSWERHPRRQGRVYGRAVIKKAGVANGARRPLADDLRGRRPGICWNLPVLCAAWGSGALVPGSRPTS